MTPWWRAALGGALAVLALDTVAALVCRATGFEYDYVAVGSLVVWGATGYVAARGRATRRLEAASAAGFVAGVADVTLGWAIAWAIGPGRLDEPLTPALWFGSAALAAAVATGVGALGGVVAARRERAAQGSAA